MEPDTDPRLAALDALVEIVPDDQLRLMFLCCHPALNADAQVALTLRLLGGLETSEIAQAFVVAESTIAQRIVRAKRKLRDNNAPYRIPGPDELIDRLPPLLASILLIFTEGHTATSGDALLRTDLTEEAIRLARVVVELLPDRFEAIGLLALLLLTDARRPARVAEDGSMVALADQDRSRWDRDRIEEGHALVRACLRHNRPDRYQILAAIAAVHTDATTPEATAWDQIVALYDQLLALRPDPIVALNRAVAVAEVDGPEAGLAGVEALDAVRLADYQPFHAARADLLARNGHRSQALAAYDRALDLTTNPAERAFLTRRLAEAAGPPPGSSGA